MSAYDPKQTDAKWYAFWEESGFFKADPLSKKPAFSIVIPPPNVTGVLHMGHALVNMLQDVLIRYKRMAGFEALWVPGTDHAGIATQTVVERHLMQTEKKRRTDYQREDFLKIIWQWKEKSEKTIIEQLKKIGCSCDWSSLRFTMDPGCSLAVKAVFKKLFDAELIYRGDYLVNWDPITQTALADDEVEYEQREGFLWTFSYPLKDSHGDVHIATTRPETLLGDTAVAIAPKDERYQHLIGRQVLLPIMDRPIPVIIDPYVDPAFGTGVVKITPAHDPNDYKIGLAHHLPMISVMHPNGQMNENAGPFAGLSREEAREAVVAHMQKLGRLVKVERHTLRVGVSYRSKAVIEPMLSKQWFVKMQPFVQPLKAAVASKRVNLIPSNWEHTYHHWIDNLRDWCISRQLWWGHRIPVWYHMQDPTRMICYDQEGVPPEVEKEPEMWEQDPDVLDTWFSSALWPFSTLGWPSLTPGLEKFYPTSVLITGHDILFFWVARMILMGEYVMQNPPFSQVFLHGLIYGKSYWKEDSQGSICYITGEEKKQYDLGKALPKGVHCKWEKLSKSKGNVIDPLELIDEYGTDAVRMTLCAIANQTPQIDLDRRRFEESKNFANKVWNGARFVLMNLENFKQCSSDITYHLEDHWILSKLSQVITNVSQAFDRYQFDSAADLAYTFFWKEFCAYYVEFCKPAIYGQDPKLAADKQTLLLIILLNAVCLLHPITPFITEELFQLLKQQFSHCAHHPYLQALQAKACIVAPYPKPLVEPNAEIEQQFNRLEQIIYAIRKIRGEMNIAPNMAVEIYLIGNFPSEQTRLIAALTKTDAIYCLDTPPSKIPFAATGVVGELQIIIPLPKQLQEQEKKRLEKEKIRLEQIRDQLSQLLENQDFLSKAKQELINKKQHEYSLIKQEIKTLIDKLANLS